MPAKTDEKLNSFARDAAMAAVSGLAIEPTSLVSYASSGVVAVIGDEQACKAASMMSAVLKPHLILSDNSNPAGNTCIRICQRDVHVEGYLGNFVITLQGGDDDVDIVKADLVLDLSDTALLAMPLKPPGYIASASTESDMQLAIDELAQMTGTFEKPKYFEYDSSICAHGRSGITACRRCIDVCPADAIKSLRESIEVDPNLCQGGGACASACPSGAIRYVYPSADDTLSLIRRLLNVYREEGGQDAIVVFHAAETEIPDSYAGNILPIVIEELASVGIEIWLSALAYGARTVLLLDDDRVPDQVRRELKRQLLTSTEILAGMGYSADAISLIDSKKFIPACHPEMPEIRPATFAGSGNKRQSAFMAIDALYEQASTVVEKQPPVMATLTPGAAFGEAIINDSSCTLCMSCVSACPGNALQNGQDVPQVLFIESLCLQCGMCTCTCPEGAISISPRILFDREQRNHSRSLYEEPPFCCVSCGKPFATKSVIDNMMKKLSGHWMFTDERAKQRLMMCEDCRVVDVIQDPEMMERDLHRGRITH
ncbi:MAG: 4Fe-4S binding protein [Pseudomonadota bacterium]|nr:4Fe-4S binding protein [Pseudomonadota bacterium]